MDDSKSSIKNKIDTAPSKTKLSNNSNLNYKFNYVHKIERPKGENPIPFIANLIPEIIINKNSNPINNSNIQITNVRSISPGISYQSKSAIGNDSRIDNSSTKYYQDQIQKFSNSNEPKIEQNKTKKFT